MQHARVRLFHTADKASLVGEGHPDAAFLYAAVGDEIPDSAAERFGIVDGRIKPAKAASSKAAQPRPATKPKSDKEKPASEDKEQRAGEDKGQ